MLNINIFAPVSNDCHVTQFFSSCQIQPREDKSTVQANKDNTFRYSFEILFFAHEQFFFRSLDCIFFPSQIWRLLTNWFAGSKGLMTESMRRMEETNTFLQGGRSIQI